MVSDRHLVHLTSCTLHATNQVLLPLAPGPCHTQGGDWLQSILLRVRRPRYYNILDILDPHSRQLISPCAHSLIVPSVPGKKQVKAYG